MTNAINVSNPKPIDPLTYHQPLRNRSGKYSFGEKIINRLKALIRTIVAFFSSSKKKNDALKLEMVSTGTSKLENRVKPVWADDEVGLKETLKTGDILFIMGNKINPVIKAGQFISQLWTGAVPTTNANQHTEHPCMYVKDEKGEEWIIENSPVNTSSEKNGTTRKLFGDGARKVPFKEHALFLQLNKNGHEDARFKNNPDIFIKVVRANDPQLASESAKTALKWSTASRPDLRGSTSRGTADDSHVQSYSKLGAGVSIFLGAADNPATKKKFLKWALLGQYPINPGEKKLPATFCSSYMTWILRVAESKNMIQQLCNRHPEDALLNKYARAIENPSSPDAFGLKNNPVRLNKFVERLYKKYSKEIGRIAEMQILPEAASPGRMFDYMKANPKSFTQVASIIPRNHPALATPIGTRVQ